MKDKISHSICVFIVAAWLFLIPNQSLIFLFAQETLLSNGFAYMEDTIANVWQTIESVPFPVKLFTGNIERGLIIFGGTGSRQGAFLTDLESNQWATIADAPFDVMGVCGDNAFGPVVFGGNNNRQVSYMRRYTDNTWIAVQSAPFAIKDITGTNEFGLIIAGGIDSKEVAYIKSYASNEWIPVANAPFSITKIAGSNQRGVIIVGGRENRQVAYMKDYSENKWYIIADAPFPVIDIAGNNATGPVIIGQNRKMAYMDNYKENIWKLIADTPYPVYQITGTNDGGVIVCGKIPGTVATDSERPVRGIVLKTSVVEFTERGDLGIQDAGAIVAEWLTTSLNKTGAFEVYERLSLSTLMEEHKLGMTGLLDDETIAEIGRIRGVDAIVTGSVIKFGDIISVTAKVIDVETAKIIKSSDIKVTDINEISSGIDELAGELARE
ncbi:hypothetical protein JW824_13065 [bacterium]|nr:hypothetical protein [bacterium]